MVLLQRIVVLLKRVVVLLQHVVGDPLGNFVLSLLPAGDGFACKQEDGR